MVRETNQGLLAALREAGWSPRDLVREVNRRLAATGQPELHPTCGYHWARGGVPRAAVPAAAAAALTEKTGRVHHIGDLWPALSTASSSGNARDGLHGMLGPWSAADVLDHAENLAHTNPANRAAMTAHDGTELVAAALDGLTAPVGAIRLGVRGTDRLEPAMLSLIERRLAELRRLDDTLGGAPLTQKLAHTDLAEVLSIVRGARYHPRLRDRLLTVASGLTQLTAWLHYDACGHGAAQRHQLLAVRLARLAQRDIDAANAIGMLAYQAALRQQPSDAVRLAEAAVDLTRDACPISQARAHGRLATAAASAGDLYRYHAAADRARTLLARGPREDTPVALYYLTHQQLDAESGQALLHLAHTSTGHTPQLLRDAITRLTPLATIAVSHGGFCRSGLLHGTYLVRAHLARRDLEGAAHTLLGLLPSIPAVHSHRCRELLRRLRGDLAQRCTNPWIRDARDGLDTALSAS